MIISRWHIEATGEELSRKQVKDRLSCSLPKEWGPSNVVSKNIFPIVETARPEVSLLQRLEVGKRVKIGDEYHRVWNIVDKFQDIPDGATKAEQEAEFLAAHLASEKLRIQSANKAACEAHIYSTYPVPIQLSLNAGIYGAEAKATYQSFLSACKTEEDRVFDLLEAAMTLELLNAVEQPVWPEA